MKSYSLCGWIDLVGILNSRSALLTPPKKTTAAQYHGIDKVGLLHFLSVVMQNCHVILS